MSIPVCGGGTVLAGANSISFTNGSGSTVYIANCTVPGFPIVAPPGYPIPNGGGSIQLSNPLPSSGSWTYSASGGCNGTSLPIRVGAGRGHGHEHE
jgi:hypothetical protein